MKEASSHCCLLSPPGLPGLHTAATDAGAVADADTTAAAAPATVPVTTQPPATVPGTTQPPATVSGSIIAVTGPTPDQAHGDIGSQRTHLAHKATSIPPFTPTPTPHPFPPPSEEQIDNMNKNNINNP